MKFHRHARSNAIHALAAPISYLRDGFAGIAEAALVTFAVERSRYICFRIEPEVRSCAQQVSLFS